mmetsp:Transcript_51936/g.100355  ORF Transcript_51936/g.100355 Transcript_51936/m.100355 type:complete len:91 (+) Transcript_51936:82-354(+)
MVLFLRMMVMIVTLTLFSFTNLAGGMDTGYVKKRGSAVRDCKADDDEEAFSIDNSKKLIQQKDKPSEGSAEEDGLGKKPTPMLVTEVDDY